MFALSRVSNALSSIWQQMPSPITLTLIAGSAYICTRTTSDYRIRAAVIAAAGVLYLIANRVQQLYRPRIPAQPRVYDLPRAVPQLPVEPITNDKSTYFDLLPAELQRKVATFCDYSVKKRFEVQAPIDPWMVEFQKGLKAGDGAAEGYARRALDAEGIHYFPEIAQTYPELADSESAIDHLRRYQTLLAPSSRLLAQKRRILKLQSLPLTGTYCYHKGPLLFTFEGSDIVTTHWPTGKILARHPHNDLSYYRCDLQGNSFNYQKPGPFLHAEYQLAPVEIIERRKLFDHAVNVEIELDQDCQEVKYFKAPYLCFFNAQGLWVKKGNAPSVLSEINSQDPMSFRQPYIISTKGVYSIETGKELLTFNPEEPCDPKLAIILKNGNPLGDMIHYLVQVDFNHYMVPGGNFREVRRSLQDPLFHESHPQQFSSVGVFTIHGRSYFMNSGGMLEIYISNLPSINHFTHEDKGYFAEGRVVSIQRAVYNSYVLIQKRHESGKIHYFVIDAAEQSLSARLPDE